jgi:hypothetical protein
MVSSLIAVLIQLLFACGAGWLLWKAWRHLTAINARAGLLIGAGMAIRALIAQAMFWISYLHLPIARSLQDGDGFWNLAIDGRAYFVYATDLLAHGWTAVAFVDKTLPSPAFLQVLAVFQLLFGGAASVGALLNLFAYVGACAAILRLGRTADGQTARPALIALAALSFAPAVIIWSVQPLKDPFFIFAVTAFVAACTLWQEAWLTRFSMTRFVVPLLLMLVILYAVVGIRWYFGLLLWAASIPFFAVSTWRSNRRAVAAAINTLVFLTFSQVIVFAGGPYVPPQLIFPFRSTAGKARPSLAAAVVESRKKFDTARANTMISSGSALQRVDASQAASEDASAPRVHIAHRKRAGRPVSEQLDPPQTTSLIIKPAVVTALTAAPDPAPVPMSSAVEAQEPAPATAPEHTDVAASEATNAIPLSQEKTQQEPRDTASASAAAVTPESSAHTPAARTTSHRATPVVREASKPKLQLSPAGRPVEKAVVPRTAIAVATRPAVIPVQTDVLPRSTFTRVTAGLAAVVLPHFIGERLGLIHIGGGRGLWAIVETDTIVFDGLLVLALYYVLRALPRGAWRNPSFWLVVITTAGITILLAYTISNFGTLFRHRAMIFIGLCLMLVVARETPRAPLPDVTGGS